MSALRASLGEGPHPAFWFDLGRLILEIEAQPPHHLMQRQLTHPVRFEDGKAVEYRVRRFPDRPMGDPASTPASPAPGS
jgi:hypothetical protein